MFNKTIVVKLAIIVVSTQMIKVHCSAEEANRWVLPIDSSK